jgi:hypothetical protein
MTYSGGVAFFIFTEGGIGTMVNVSLKCAILKRFGSQNSFAQAVGVGAPLVSRVVHCHECLDRDRVRQWAKVLRCPMKVFKPDGNGN